MGYFTIQALAGTVIQLTSELGRFLFHCIIVVAILLVFSVVLPTDPFQPVIIQLCNTISYWSDFIGYFIPHRFIVSSYLFSAVFRYFYYVYRVFCAHWDALTVA